MRPMFAALAVLALLSCPAPAEAQLFPRLAAKAQAKAAAHAPSVCTGPNCQAETATICTGPDCQAQPTIRAQPAYSTPAGPGRSLVDVPCSQHELILEKLWEPVDITGASGRNEAAAGNRMDRLISATVRVTVSGVCGSGTVVGRDSLGNALVLTNAHVAGTQRGRVVSLQRWNPDGTSEKGNGAIIAAGYGRGLSVDFALLKCNAEFAAKVDPIPLADRYPQKGAPVTTYGCPRCEWPSMQVLSLTRSEGQVLQWLPEAIGGRSGSSVIDHTDDGPRVVGLLTWGGGGEGLGQSTPFLLSAMRGAMPKSYEMLPDYAQEVATVKQVPCGLNGELLAVASFDLLDAANPASPLNPLNPASPLHPANHLASNDASGQTDSDVIDSIVEDGPDAPEDSDDCGLLNRKPNDDGKLLPIKPNGGLLSRIKTAIAFAFLGAVLAGLAYLYLKNLQNKVQI
ncbi:trypsin-like serine peptidase [Aureliella helgolandensis]|uniref:Trypsin n=1 Tax=Aureliella helgolandensis TaxID=2527968 RepID=A0A518G744_9BACT|nr:serine protease [Aureliella helgolandensis]QDV24405.1 Trypsin [Aureliella helgolandensis]